METQHSIKYSFEKVIRVNDKNETFEKSSFVIEAPISVGSKNCRLVLTDQDKKDIFFDSFLIIDSKTGSVKNKNSHEDPLIEDSGNYLVCFQVPLEIIKFKKLNAVIYADEMPIFDYQIGDNIISEVSDKNLSSIDFSKNEVSSKEECELTLHLTDLDGNYKERVIKNYKHEEPFNFSHLIGKYNYIGIQFSYSSNLVETEEKYILVGQKSMKFSQLIQTNVNKYIYPVIYNNSQFLPKSDGKEFKEVFNINNLIHLLEIEKPYLFDISFDYIKQSYLTHCTYNQNKMFSSKAPNNIRTHMNLAVCKNCELKSYCLQVVPSGLTEELFKKNIGIDNASSCKIYKIINKALKTKS